MKTSPVSLFGVLLLAFIVIGCQDTPPAGPTSELGSSSDAVSSLGKKGGKRSGDEPLGSSSDAVSSLGKKGGKRGGDEPLGSSSDAVSSLGKRSSSDAVSSLGKKGGKQGGDQPQGDPEVLALMHKINEELAARGLNIAVEAIEFFTIGQGRPSNRIHQQPFRWVAGDTRRLPGLSGNDITFLVDGTFQGTSSGVSPAATATEIRTAMAKWDADKSLKKLSLIENPDPGIDVSFFDDFLEAVIPLPPGTVDPEPAPGIVGTFAADIVNVGWYPRTIFDVLLPPIGGDFILAFSVTFIFLGDINGDNYLDTALKEVYYNDNFPNAFFPASPWTTGQMALPDIDVQTVALHENGHSLEIGHFGPPPAAVMNPVYAGPRISPFRSDHAGMAAVWGGWPK